MSERKRLWQKGCVVQDVILASTFDSQEIETICGAPTSADGCIRMPSDYRVFTRAHHRCYALSLAIMRSFRCMAFSGSFKVEEEADGAHHAQAPPGA
ncbi:MAG: hypothetical protein HYY93_14575 [Planctomycetes bacterium]|nr:hypothetical protein [Planctomycetota bacterium]